jgi:putative redox protein
MHSPADKTVDIENGHRIFAAAKHPKSFVAIDGADHLLSSPTAADYVASVISAWSAWYAGNSREGHARNLRGAGRDAET